MQKKLVHMVVPESAEISQHIIQCSDSNQYCIDYYCIDIIMQHMHISIDYCIALLQGEPGEAMEANKKLERASYSIG